MGYPTREQRERRFLEPRLCTIWLVLTAAKASTESAKGRSLGPRFIDILED